MAEPKINDTEPPLARRAARPFVGPAGPAAPTRPLLRPTGPAGRPSPAAFARPLAAPRSSLGTLACAQPAAPAADDDARDAATTRPVARVEPPEPSQLPSLGPQPRQPVTSEMVALDAFAAFDAVWGRSTTPAASPVVEPVASPLHDASLGTGVGAHELRVEDITPADVEAMHAVEEPFGPTAGADHGVAPADALESAWPTITTPDSAMPAWLVDDNDPTGPSPPPQPTRDLLVAGATDTSAGQPDEAVDPRVAHGLRVSAALDRLAKRVRGGEIDVSSVAPEAPDAAVLASVLAALLGGSSSR